MGKINGGSSSSSSSSWFNAVKRAFGSPSKKITNTCTTTTDTHAAADNNNKKTTKRREEHELEDEEKKRGKRRWMNFSNRKSSSNSSNSSSTTGRRQQQQHETTTTTTTVILHHCGSRMAVSSNSPSEHAASKQRHALAVAMATTEAAQAVVATAQAAVEVARLAAPSLFVKQHFAAVSIQTAFRGYLGRRALRGLKGVVKLQSLVRGQNVRRRAKLTLHCIQSLLRVQAQVLHHRNNHLPTKHSLEQCFRDGDSYWDTDHASADAVAVADDDDDDDDHDGEVNPALEEEEIRSILQQTHQLWSGGGERRRDAELVRYASEGEACLENRWRRRASCDSTATSSIKTVEMDTRSLNIHPTQSFHRRRRSNSPASPLHHHHQPISSPKLPPAVVGVYSRSGSPRCSAPTMVPSYMAATESAKARLRSQSAPRNRNSVTPFSPTRPSDHNREQQRSGGSNNTTTSTAKKRLYFPTPHDAGGDYDYDAEYRLRSPSYNNRGVVVNTEQRSKMTSSSSYADSVLTGTDEIISDQATNHEVTRWLLR